MQAIAAPLGQAFSKGHDHRRIRRRLQPRDQRHGVGRAAEKIRPYAFSHPRRLIRQDADRFAALQCPVEQTHALQARRREAHLTVHAAGFHHGFQTGTFGRTVQHRQRQTLRTVMRGNFKTAEMGGEKNEAVAGALRGLNQPPVIAGHQSRKFFPGAEPYFAQFHHALAGFSHRRMQCAAQLRVIRTKTAGAQVLPAAPAPGRRQAIHQPTQPCAEKMQPRQRHTRAALHESFQHRKAWGKSVNKAWLICYSSGLFAAARSFIPFIHFQRHARSS